MREIEGLEQGSLVALKPDGRRAEIESHFGDSPLAAQVHARAETLLDRELTASRADRNASCHAWNRGESAWLSAPSIWSARVGA